MEKSNIINKDSLIKFLDNRILDCILVQKNTNKDSIDYIYARQSKFTYIHIKQEIERGEFDAN